MTIFHVLKYLPAGVMSEEDINVLPSKIKDEWYLRLGWNKTNSCLDIPAVRWSQIYHSCFYNESLNILKQILLEYNEE